MNVIESLIVNKDNVALIGGPGCGKTVVLKNILINLVASSKKVLLLDYKSEHKSITIKLGGNHEVYNSQNKIYYDNMLTTISFRNLPETEIIFKIIKDAENNGVDAVLIDDAYICLKECEKLSSIQAQIIVSTQFDSEILSKGNLESFKNVFTKLFLMGHNLFDIRITYPQLLFLYNIDKRVIEEVASQRKYESTIIKDNELLETNFKLVYVKNEEKGSLNMGKKIIYEPFTTIEEQEVEERKIKAEMDESEAYWDELDAAQPELQAEVEALAAKMEAQNKEVKDKFKLHEIFVKEE